MAGYTIMQSPGLGYTSPEGVKGVDNAFYTVGGCVGYWRGPAKGSDGFKYSNEDMHNGDYTILIRLSGEKDPMNDPSAKLTFMMSDDKLVRDANGGIAGRQVEIIAEDDGTDPRQGITVFEQFTEDRSVIIGPTLSNGAFQAQPIAQEALQLQRSQLQARSGSL